jgi:hypothetical protein
MGGLGSSGLGLRTGKPCSRGERRPRAISGSNVATAPIRARPRCLLRDGVRQRVPACKRRSGVQFGRSSRRRVTRSALACVAGAVGRAPRVATGGTVERGHAQLGRQPYGPRSPLVSSARRRSLSSARRRGSRSVGGRRRRNLRGAIAPYGHSTRLRIASEDRTVHDLGTLTSVSLTLGAALLAPP